MFSNLRTPETKKLFAPMSQFYLDAKMGTLPNYAFLSPIMFPTTEYPANDQHPDHSVLEGERLMKNVYESLRASPLWNDVLLIITYDEHGGFYDHVPPPIDVPNPDGRVSVDPPCDFDRLGIRVPTVMISPWIDKGVLVHRPTGPTPTSQFEHSSVPATLKKLFHLKSFLTKRDEWAGTFEEVYSNRTAPRTNCPVTLPPLPPPSREDHMLEGNKPLNDLQKTFMHQGCDVPTLSDEQIEKLTQFEGAEIQRKRFEYFLRK